MLPTVKVILAVVLMYLLVQLVDGNQRIVHVSEPTGGFFTNASGADGLISDDKEFMFSGEGDGSLLCCVYGNCSCNSLARALANLASNVLINITTDVMLSSLTKALNLVNVSIIGHNNPTVNCMKNGGIRFKICHNCIIQDIIWNGCGTKAKPGIKFSDSSNIIIVNCSFQYSKGLAVVLSGVSGHANISDCNFVHNNHYEGHGAAIHVQDSSINCTNHIQFWFTISSCNFTYNKHAESLVYIESIFSKCNNTMMFKNSRFSYNKGVSIYVVNQKIYLLEKVLFLNNIAENGAGIYMKDHSTVVFGENSYVAFIQNSAVYYGGAVFLRNHSSIIIDQNCIATFNDNNAKKGTIYSEVSSNVTFQTTCKVTFSSNSVKGYGAAIYSNSYSCVSFKENSTTEFTNNAAQYGGAICSRYSSLSFEQSSTTKFTNNAATRLYHNGGAINLKHCNISFEGNSTTKFTNNIAAWSGGGIYCEYCNIYFKENSFTEFTGNTAKHGGAINIDFSSSVSFQMNSTTEFTSNTVPGIGGAICSEDSSISFEGNSTTEFINNTALLKGGGIYIFSEIKNSSITFKENSYTKFTNTVTVLHGGAILSEAKPSTNVKSIISFEDNCITIFANNTARSGSGIYSIHSSLSFETVSNTKFSNNFANSNGGAIYMSTDTQIIFKTMCHVEFTNNEAKTGGAIYSINEHSTPINSISFQGLSAVVFSSNNAKDYGGAIATKDMTTITFSGRSTVTFTDNSAVLGETAYCGSNSNVTTRGDPTVIFNGVLAKWCRNCCQPYTSEGAVIIDGNGIALCNDQKAFACQSRTCYCKLFHYVEPSLSNAVINIADKAILHTRVVLMALTNVSIIGQNNLTIICTADDNGARGNLLIASCNNLTIQGITWVGCGGYKIQEDDTLAVFNIYSSTGTVQKNTFHYLKGPAINFDNSRQHLYFKFSHFTIDQCNFMNNIYRDHGAAIILRPSRFSSNDTQLIISNCDYNYNEGVASIVYLKDHHVSMYFNNTRFYNSQGVSIYSSRNCFLLISGDILFANTTAENGAGIYISDHSTVIFGENSNVKFFNNSVDHKGSAIFVSIHSSVTFEQNSMATFNDNKGTNGTIYSKDNSNITFKATSQVIFNSNTVTQYGAAIYSFDNSHITFTGSANVTLSNNVVSTNEESRDIKFGGIIFSSTYCHTSFNGNATIVFSNNSANVGASIFLFYKSTVTFKDKSKVMFNSNVAQYCGILASTSYSNIFFNDNTEVTFNYNTMSCTSNSNYEQFAGAICTSQRANVMFSGHSVVTFINNTANYGGAVVFSDSYVTIEEHSTVTFNSNIAEYSNGGAFVCFNNSIVTIKDNSNVTFNSNKASQSGGAIHSYSMCKIEFKGNSTLSFIKNTARDSGGVILSNPLSEITFEGNSTITFDGNIADNGGTFYVTNSTITFKDTSMISFYNNKARQNGGVGYFSLDSKGIFEGTTIMNYYNNIAEQNAGVLYSINSKIFFKGNSMLTLTHNRATSNGGAFHFDHHSDVLFSQFTNVTLDHNIALYGGAVLANDHSSIKITGNSVLQFANNEATMGGGAANIIHNSTFILKYHITVNFTSNKAQYGGSILLDASAAMINYDNNSINFINNDARILGNSIYQDITDRDLCSRGCITDRVVGISTEFIATPPNELRFYDPAVCIDDDNDTQCNRYYVQNIMPGSDIVIPACVLDYYNYSVESTPFLVQSEISSDYIIDGPEQILIGCNSAFQGISILSDPFLPKPTNLSVDIKLNINHNPDWKQISVTLVFELSQCHPGFWQSSKLQECECYNANDIVFCSGSSSTIKRGYWFGSVTGKPTVTYCPINYCNFTCCETSNGYYHLSPIRNDQCRSHRSGVACGSCKYGYTLSFDSTECLNIESCTVGQTVMVILLTVTYWIAIVIIVFTIMYYRVGIGYMYCITYYYSIADIILSQNLQASRGLYLTVSIMSSCSKLTPQFLGELCLINGMSGIDQQFIHFIHPTTIIVILIAISLSARSSVRISAFISRAIIRVICLLLLLSYTSIASTSLLLMRSLLFHDIDKVYTYVSPDIEYFHGRHLAYGIVALLCIVTIVIGLPLLLIIEPLINHKINFTRIKPLLDQFQGCYTDKYHCFAGYYMICRLVLIAIIIFDFTNDFVASYAVIIVCGMVDFIHALVKPYNKEILNKFDATILHLMNFIAALQLIDDSDSPIVVATAFVLVILPLIIFIALTLFLNRNNVKKIIMYFTSKKEPPSNNDDNNKTPMANFDLVIDDSMRKNATICVV